MLRLFITYIFLSFNFHYTPNNKIVLINKKVPTLNSGGCGYFALKLYQKLDKERYKLVVINNLYHVLVWDKETDSLIDANGIHSQQEWLKYYRDAGDNPYIWEITEYDLETKVNDISIWNRTFNRKDTLIVNKFIDSL